MTSNEKIGRPFKVALVGNPNVGKSSIFNALTGMHQHTGNWAGKTVDTARGVYKFDGERYELYDLPGCYTLWGGVGEERVSGEFLISNPDYPTVVVCDATCLERSLILALQVIDTRLNAVICINLMDEARKKGITIDVRGLSKATGVPCIAVSAARGEGIRELRNILIIKFVYAKV